MQSVSSSSFSRHSLRFSLLAMFEYVTICAIICGLIPLIGPWSAVCLMLTALAIAARQGELALVSLGVAVVLDPFVESISIAGQLLTMGAAAGLGIWFRWRSERDPQALDCVTRRRRLGFPGYIGYWQEANTATCRPDRPQEA